MNTSSEAGGCSAVTEPEPRKSTSRIPHTYTHLRSNTFLQYTRRSLCESLTMSPRPDLSTVQLAWPNHPAGLKTWSIFHIWSTFHQRGCSCEVVTTHSVVRKGVWICNIVPAHVLSRPKKSFFNPGWSRKAADWAIISKLYIKFEEENVSANPRLFSACISDPFRVVNTGHAWTTGFGEKSIIWQRWHEKKSVTF